MEALDVLIPNVYQESFVPEIETVLEMQSVLEGYALIDVEANGIVESTKTVLMDVVFQQDLVQEFPNACLSRIAIKVLARSNVDQIEIANLI